MEANKSAVRGEYQYSLGLRNGRICLYCWHGATEPRDYESMDFPATVEDFNSFDGLEPQLWFAFAAQLIGDRR